MVSPQERPAIGDLVAHETARQPQGGTGVLGCTELGPAQLDVVVPETVGKTREPPAEAHPAHRDSAAAQLADRLRRDLYVSKKHQLRQLEQTCLADQAPVPAANLE